MARHWREATSRPALGQPLTGSHYAQATQRDSNAIPFAGRADSLRGDWPDSPGEDWEPFIMETDVQERAAMRFALFCCAAPFILFGILYLVIKLFS